MAVPCSKKARRLGDLSGPVGKRNRSTLGIDIDCTDFRKARSDGGRKGEKLCGVELEDGGGECHVREELVGVTRTMARKRERGKP